MKLNKFFMVLILVLVSNIVFASGRVGLIIEPPNFDGGCRLLVYHIEYKKIESETWHRRKPFGVIMVDKGNGWFEYVKQKYVVDNLTEGETYIFRVIVENLAGEGKPGLPTHEITITKEDIDRVDVKSGPAMECKSRSFSYLSDTPSANHAQGTRLLYRKEE